MGPDLSKETIRRAISLARCAAKLGFKEPICIVSENHQDSVTYIFSTKDSMVIVCCSPSCYLVSHGKKDHLTIEGAEYLIIKNVRTFLMTLRKQGYKSLTRVQLRKIEKEMKAKEREPNDDELSDIEDDEDGFIDG